MITPKDALVPLTEWGEPYEVECPRCGAIGSGVDFRGEEFPTRTTKLCPKCAAEAAEVRHVLMRP